MYETVDPKVRMLSTDQGSHVPLVGALALLVYAALAASTAQLGTVETDVLLDKYATIPANRLEAGSVVHVRAWGKYTSTTGAETVTVALKIGSTAVATFANADPANNDYFYFDVQIVVRTAGASGTMVAGGTALGSGASGTGTAKVVCLDETALDTTGALTVGVWVDRQGTATDTDSLRLDGCNVVIWG